MSKAVQLLPVEEHHAGLMGYGPPVEALVFGRRGNPTGSLGPTYREALIVVLLGRRKSPWQGRLS